MQSRTLLLSLMAMILAACAKQVSYPIQPGPVSEANDNIIHTTVYHNAGHKRLDFLVTFEVGYFDAKGHCKMQKQRIFKASHPDGDHALTLGHHLANEYGPELFNCVHETLHVIDSPYPDEAMTYRLMNNGRYYTKAYPDRHDVYPRL